MDEAEWLTSCDVDQMLLFVCNRKQPPTPPPHEGTEAATIHYLEQAVRPATTYHRKRRLFACACCRRGWHMFADRVGRNAVEVAERFADSGASQEELDAAYHAVHRARPGITRAARMNTAAAYAAADYTDAPFQWSISNFDGGFTASATMVLYAVESVDSLGLALKTLGELAIVSPVRSAAWEQEKQAQSDLLRDLFSNPFRLPPAIDPAWLSWNGGTVQRQAEAIYQERSLPDGHLDASRMGVLADALEDVGCDDSDILNHFRRPAVHVRGCWAVDLILGKE